jgi:hypothetical protein
MIIEMAIASDWPFWVISEVKGIKSRLLRLLPLRKTTTLHYKYEQVNAD